MTTSVTIGKIMDAFHDRYDSSYAIALSVGELRTTLHLESVRRCVAVGCGTCIMELPFLQHGMPNLSEFIAVEPDAWSAAELKLKLAKYLPAVRSIVVQETVQHWRGDDKPVDAVLLLRCLYYLNPQERLELYKRLFDTVVRPGGFVFVIIHPFHTSGEPSAYCKIYQQLNSSEERYHVITESEVRTTVLSAGFELCHEKMYHCHVNVQDPDDTFLSVFLAHVDASLESARRVSKEVFGDSKQVRHDHWLGVFRKP